MTLLLKVSPTPETAVFSGDKRLTNADGSGFEDTFRKATPLGDFAVGGATGGTRYVDQKTAKIEQFNVHGLLEDFFRGRRMDEGTIAEFVAFLKGRYAQYATEHGDPKPLTPDGYLFAIIAASFQDGAIRDHQFRCFVPGGAYLDVRAKTFPPCNLGILMPSGDPEITDAIRSNHPALEEIYAHPDIRLLLERPPVAGRFGIVSVDRAIEVCKIVNRVCSDRFEEIAKKPSTISPNCDVYLLDKSGVRQVG